MNYDGNEYCIRLYLLFIIVYYIHIFLLYHIFNNYIISYYLFVGMRSTFGSMNDISAMKGMGVGRGRGGRGKRERERKEGERERERETERERERERQREREREASFLFCLSVL
jgi:hypothetical protein